MTSKIQIDEQMIDRAAKSLERDGWVDGRVVAKRVLEAALNPPEEPGIPVSEGMIAAGRPHIIAGYEEKPQYYCIDLAAIYVAMEKARRKESGFDGPDRRSGNQRRQPFWRQHWRLDQAPPWAVRGDAWRDRTRKGRRKTDNP